MHTTKKTHASILKAATGLAVLAATAVLASGCKAPSSSSAGSGPSPAAPAVSDSSSGLRTVHSPGKVADDENLAAGQCHAQTKDGAAGVVLPDPACTPGAIDPAVTQDNIASTICKSGYTDTVRPPAADTNKFKADSYKAYGIPASDKIEEDHLVSLELGGANSESNLWVEPNKAGASSTTNPKDAVESKLKTGVCDHKVPLATAQKLIAADWTTALQKAGLR